MQSFARRLDPKLTEPFTLCAWDHNCRRARFSKRRGSDNGARCPTAIKQPQSAK